jgi:phosphatidylinositol 4-kinase
LASSNDSFAHQRVEKFVTKIIGDKFNYAIPQLVTGNNHHEEEEVFYDAAADRTTFLSKASSSDAYDFTMPPTRGDNAPAVHTNLQTGLQERLSSVNSETSVHQCSTPSLFKMKRTGIKDMASRTFNIYGEGRRQVLTTIFMKGMKSPNLIARSVAPAAQRAAQAIDAHLAVNLLLRDREKNRRRDQEKISESMCDRSYEDSKEYALSLAMKASLEVEQEDSVNYSSLSSSDECMESLRLLLIRDRIAKGLLSLEGAAKVLYASQNSGSNSSNGELSSSFQEENSIAFEPNGDVVEAGNLDARLSGCGAVGPAVASSIRMWKEGVITDTELLDLVQKDTVFSRMSFPGKENESKLQEDSAFWEKFAFGELWAQKKARIQSSSRFGTVTGWDLCGVIVKSNDDVRQEAFVMQLIELCKEIFDQAGLDVWLQPYRILATSKSTGILEMVRNAMSIDSLKKRPGFSKGGLLGHFERMAQVAADPCEALMTSKRNFVRSLAAYSLISYLFNIKDRHNGNLLLDSVGHIIHIDFGFVFGIAPGGTFSLEQSVPFKLTDEMIQVMDGVGSKLFLDFLMLFCCGFVALQMHADTFLTLVEITCAGSTFKCFEGRDHTEILENLRSRFCLHLSKETTISFAMDLIYQATTTNGTARYDFFQYISNGIAT